MEKACHGFPWVFEGSSCIFFVFSGELGYPSWRQERPRWRQERPRRFQDHFKSCQDSSKTAQDRLAGRPRSLQDDTRLPQDRTRMPQDPARSLQDRPRVPQDSKNGPSWHPLKPQEQSKTTPASANTIPKQKSKNQPNLLLIFLQICHRC